MTDPKRRDNSLFSKILVATSALDHNATMRRGVVLVVKQTARSVRGVMLQKQISQSSLGTYPLLWGGPCGNQDDNAFSVLFRGSFVPEPPFMSPLCPGIGYGSLEVCLPRLAVRVCHPQGFAVFKGFCHWTPAELTQEIDAGKWQTLPFDCAAVFSEKRDDLWALCHEKAQRPGAEANADVCQRCLHLVT